MIKYRCAGNKSRVSSDENFHVALKTTCSRRAWERHLILVCTRRSRRRGEVKVSIPVNKPVRSTQSEEEFLAEEDDHCSYQRLKIHQDFTDQSKSKSIFENTKMEVKKVN